MAGTKTAIYTNDNGDVIKTVRDVSGDNFAPHDEVGLTRIEITNTEYVSNADSKGIDGVVYFPGLLPFLRDNVSGVNPTLSQKLQDKIDDIAAYDAWWAAAIQLITDTFNDMLASLNPAKTALWEAYRDAPTDQEEADALAAFEASLNNPQMVKWQAYQLALTYPNKPTIR